MTGTPREVARPAGGSPRFSGLSVVIGRRRTVFVLVWLMVRVHVVGRGSGVCGLTGGGASRCGLLPGGRMSVVHAPQGWW